MANATGRDMSRAMPPLIAPRARFGMQTPPALFPPLLGAFGLGLAWRRAADVFAVPAAAGEVILGAVSLLFLFCLGTYGLKVLRRPAVVTEDLRVLPGRAGLSALVLSVYLLAVALAPLAAPAAHLLLWAGLALHGALVALAIRALVTGPPEQRAVTPVWHLQFVGVVVAGLAAVPLGYDGLATTLLVATAIMAVAIWAASLLQLVRREVPAPLRPLLAIHLAPAAVLGSVAALTGRMDLAVGFAALAGALLLALVARPGWLLRAGFTPFWGAFTFPLAAFAGLMLTLAAAGQGGAFRVAGGIALVAASLVIPPILVKVMQAWMRGGLGAATNAARV